MNGGQTTASIHAAHRRRVDVSHDLRSDEALRGRSGTCEQAGAQDIGVANSQNRVSAADFFANHPFHVRMEEISPAASTHPRRTGRFRESKWFYERARDQYADARGGLTPARRKKFDLSAGGDQQRHRVGEEAGLLEPRQRTRHRVASAVPRRPALERRTARCGSKRPTRTARTEQRRGPDCGRQGWTRVLGGGARLGRGTGAPHPHGGRRAASGGRSRRQDSNGATGSQGSRGSAKAPVRGVHGQPARGSVTADERHGPAHTLTPRGSHSTFLAALRCPGGWLRTDPAAGHPPAGNGPAATADSTVS